MARASCDTSLPSVAPNPPGSRCMSMMSSAVVVRSISIGAGSAGITASTGERERSPGGFAAGFCRVLAMHRLAAALAGALGRCFRLSKRHAKGADRGEKRMNASGFGREAESARDRALHKF